MAMNSTSADNEIQEARLLQINQDLLHWDFSKPSGLELFAEAFNIYMKSAKSVSLNHVCHHSIIQQNYRHVLDTYSKWLKSRPVFERL